MYRYDSDTSETGVSNFSGTDIKHSPDSEAETKDGMKEERPQVKDVWNTRQKN
jgi:hypothetical protein